MIFLTLYKATWAILQMTQNCIAQSVYQRTLQFCRMTLTLFCNIVAHGCPFLTFLNVIIAPLVIVPPTLSIFSSENDGTLTRILTISKERDVCIVFEFDWDLKFTSHVNQIVMKAKRVLGIIKHTFASGDAHIII